MIALILIPCGEALLEKRFILSMEIFIQCCSHIDRAYWVEQDIIKSDFLDTSKDYNSLIYQGLGHPESRNKSESDSELESELMTIPSSPACFMASELWSALSSRLTLDRIGLGLREGSYELVPVLSSWHQMMWRGWRDSCWPPPRTPSQWPPHPLLSWAVFHCPGNIHLRLCGSQKSAVLEK